MKEHFANIDFRRVRFGALAVVLSALAAWFGQPSLHKHPQAMDTIVTVFSILAGFLVAIISIVGDSTSFGRGSWRRDHFLLDGIKQRLIRHRLMFQLYLVVLGLVFFVQLVGVNDAWAVWYERVMLFLASFAFLVSLSLPDQLMAERLKKLNEQASPPPEQLIRRMDSDDRQ